MAGPSRSARGPLKVFGLVFIRFLKASAVKHQVSQLEVKAKLLHGASTGPVWPCCQAGRVALSLVRVEPALPPGGPVATLCPAQSRPGGHGREPSESSSIPALPLPTQCQGGSEKRPWDWSRGHPAG